MYYEMHDIIIDTGEKTKGRPVSQGVKRAGGVPKYTRQ
jgi:hypothetical protein